VHFNLTRHPNSFWIAQQLREAFPAGHPHKYLILIVMGSLDMRCFRQWMRLSLCLSGLHSGVRGRTEWQSVGSKAAGVICSIKRNRDSQRRLSRHCYAEAWWVAPSLRSGCVSLSKTAAMQQAVRSAL
jgi:hypothetical protein